MTMRFMLDLETPEIEKEMHAWGESSFRAQQIVKWVYQRKAESFSECSDLSVELRRRLEENFTLRSLKIKSKDVSRLDGTTRYNFLTRDRYRIPSVLLPFKDRNSICLSTQVGCAVGCEFCASGRAKFRRNLSRGEILEQILQVEKESGRRISGVLFMGMGEPLLNYDNVVSSLQAIVNFRQLGLGRRHITVSTVGIVPMIRKLAEEKPGVRLALSLHAADDATRRKFIPDKVPYSVKEILDAGLYYSRRNNARLTIEYTLVPGVNDTLLSVQKFVKLIQKSSRAKDEVQVNLIPCNATSAPRGESPSEESVRRFWNYLVKHGVLAIIREAKGADIGAACGQLGV